MRQQKKAKIVFSRDCPKRNSCGYFISRVVMDKSLLDRHSIQQFKRTQFSYRHDYQCAFIGKNFSLFYIHIKLSPSLHNFYHRHRHHYIFCV